MNAYLLKQQKQYPVRTIQDDIKWLYQSYLGCEHFVSDFDKALHFIQNEANKEIKINVEPLNENFVRVHFGKLSEIEAKVLARLFVASSRVKYATMEDFKRALVLYKDTLDNSDKDFVENYIQQGCPSVHHSEIFRNQYQPSYRVIDRRYWSYFKVLCEIEKKPNGIIGIDGRCGSGKSTLASLIGELYQCPVIHMDDFFLPLELRNEQRFKEPGGNVHYERFKEEVYEPLKKNEEINYGVFDCSQMAINEYRKIAKSSLYVIEGTYAFHSTLIDLYDYKIFMTIDKNLQKERIIERNGINAWENFEKRWIPLEEKYFDAYHLETKVDFVFEGGK